MVVCCIVEEEIFLHAGSNDLNDRCNSNSKKSIKDIAVACNCCSTGRPSSNSFLKLLTVQYIKNAHHFVKSRKEL